MFRTRNGDVQVFLVHPGGPFFRNKDEGAWTIPKGEAVEGEDLFERAKIEFEEEIGVAAVSQSWIELGSIKQKGGKTVRAWAFEGDLAPDFKILSNDFELEWPPRSGQRRTFPEVDRARFFSIGEARHKINPAQRVLLDRLMTSLGSTETA